VQFDVQRRLAIAELLAQPDPPELRRGHRLRLEGKPDRYALLPLLAAVFVQDKLLALSDRREHATAVAPERPDVRWVKHGGVRREVLAAA
jgi:hypothetical protein